MDLRQSLASIWTPTLVIAGADDPVTPPSFPEEIGSAVSGATVEVVPVAGHLANVGLPALVTKLLLDHLSGEA